MTERSLLTKTAVALSLGAILVVICYFFVDRPVAWFVHDHGSCLHGLLRWPPLISDRLRACAVPAIIVIVLWWAWKPGGRCQTVLLAISANLIVTTALKQFLKWGFGRCWPETWIAGNPSLISNGVYGFYPFHGGTAYEAFPSGHAAVICCVLSILWLSYPRGRWLYATIGGGVCVALVGMNYHFTSDVIAGTMLGSVTGICMTRLFRLSEIPAQS